MVSAACAVAAAVVIHTERGLGTLGSYSRSTSHQQSDHPRQARNPRYDDQIDVDTRMDTNCMATA